ncbi:Diaminopimelate decarboxylase [hydrothermal vent metagenome]|uniref:Diaminopimelate decarboxylase n=1 Tax=hydrothermal vent metagenome TaxID=652676 RepID=A0A3B0YVW4_9ZZZZ
MDHFSYQQGVLCAEDVSLERVAEQFGTPCYVYSRATIERHWAAFDQAFSHHSHLICYSVKACSNIAILHLLAKVGSGFDIVSGGELSRVIKAGGSPAKVVFSGVGKSSADITQALQADIRCFNVESAAELERINTLAANENKIAPVSLRVNPDVDAKTHPYISTGLKENKFGIEMEQAVVLFQRAKALPHINLSGIDCHIGSQLTEVTPFLDALDRVLLLIDELKEHGIELDHIDIGGGLGIRYQNETPPEPSEYANAIAKKLGDRDLEILLEPGRAIMGNAGIMLTRVEYLKSNNYKNFAIIDAAMNDLIRPSLYDAWQDIIPIQEAGYGIEKEYDVVGPICETGDFLGKKRLLGLAENALLAVRSSGAYGAVMSSNYNTRPRAPEILIDGDKMILIRKREIVEELYQNEIIPDEL